MPEQSQSIQIEFSAVSPEETEFLYSGMEQNFIRDEIRDYKDFVAVMNEPLYRLSHIYCNGTLVGFVGLWELHGFAFIEHIVIYKEYRNRGFGSAAIKNLRQKYGRLVLEIEPPTDADQKRRLNFYMRNGLVLNHFDYIQPSYRKDGNGVPLKLMSYPEPIEDSEKIVKELYREVYKVI